VRKGILRTTAVGLVAAGALVGTGVTPVHAAPISSFSDAVGDVLDPILSQNRLVAVPSSSPRPYADLTHVTATASGGQVAFTITVNGAIPTFPVTNGDTGIEINACFDIPNGEPIASGPVIVGYGHHGAPIYDGPYNSRYGWKVCAWASAQAGGTANIEDYGVATFDPVGQYTFFDKAQLTSGSAATTLTGNSSFTFYFPYTWVTKVAPPAPPEQGIARTESRTFLSIADASAINLTVSTQVSASVTLPTTVCEPVECSVLGPIQGVGGLLTTVDWAPGRQVCSTAVTSCINDDGGSGAGNGYDLGLLPVGFPAGAVQDCDAANLTASCPVVGPSTVPYDPCFSGQGDPTKQDNGDLYAILSAAGLGASCTQHGPIPWPYEYHTVNGRTLVPNTPMYTPDAAGFAIT
jgi:hypothetical protein